MTERGSQKRLLFFFVDLCGKAPAAWYNGLVEKKRLRSQVITLKQADGT